MKTYTKKEIAFILQCSVRTIDEDLKYLKFKPIDNEDYGTNLYSESQFIVIKSLRKHCRKKGRTRETFVTPTSVEIVERPLDKIVVKPPTITDRTNTIVAEQLNIDPLYDLELLQRICDNKWLLPTKRLAAIINVSPKTLVKEDSYKYSSYLFIRRGVAGMRGSWLWETKRYFGKD